MQVFISYAHQDKAFFEELRQFLVERVPMDGVRIWADQKLSTGAEWDVEIKAQIQEADIALALVSSFFLSSTYCIDIEIRSFQERSAKIFPVLLSDCPWRSQDWLRGRQMFKGGKTVKQLSRRRGGRTNLLFEIRNELQQEIQKIRASRSSQSQAKPSESIDKSSL